MVYILCRDDTPSLTLLADMTAQAKAIEILISHVNEVCVDTSKALKHGNTTDH